MNSNEAQPDPIANNNPAIWPLIIEHVSRIHIGSRDVLDLLVADMVDRHRIGVERYGVPLQAGNGRDALIDAYQEALDLCAYMRQAHEEGEGTAYAIYLQAIHMAAIIRDVIASRAIDR